MKTNYPKISPFGIDGNTNIDGNTHAHAPCDHRSSSMFPFLPL
jgi:hypothetical protein